MLKYLFTIIITIAAGITGTCCAQHQNSNTKISFLGKDRPYGCIEKKLRQEFKSSVIYNDEIIEGYWFKPHDAEGENIFFHKGNLFEMVTYQYKHGQLEDIYKTGTYELKGDSIYLKSYDGWRLTLRYWKPWPKDNSHYITKGKKSNFRIYLVKGS